MRIQANPTALASYGLSLEDVRTALAAANVDQAKGNFDGPRQAYTIGANDQLLSAPTTIPSVSLPTATARRYACRMSPTSIDGAENIMQAAWMNDEPGGHRQHPAPAGRQHHRRGGPHQEAAAAAAGLAARRRCKFTILTDRTTPFAPRSRTCSSS